MLKIVGIVFFWFTTVYQSSNSIAKIFEIKLLGFKIV